MDEIQLRYQAEAKKLQKEMQDAGYKHTRVEKSPDDHIVFNVYTTLDGTKVYRVNRDYRGFVHVWRKEEPRFADVYSSTRSEVYKKHTGGLNRIKVITSKKIAAAMAACDAYIEEMQALQLAHAGKISAFLEDMRALEAKGYKVTYRHDRYDDRETITGGEVIANGIEFSFSIGNDGYVSKKLDVHYSVEHTLEAFQMLAANKYTI